MSCVFCGGGLPVAAAEGTFDPGGDDPRDAGFATLGFCMLGMSCVPGAFFAAALPACGGGGLVPVPRGAGPVGDDCGPPGTLAGTRSPATCWNAPRCESALLTASGETGGAGCVPSRGPGAPDGGFALVAGGGPYGEPTAREDGDAVAANGFTPP